MNPTFDAAFRAQFRDLVLWRRDVRRFRSEIPGQRAYLLNWAEFQLENAGLGTTLSTLQNANQAVHDLIGSNLALPDWMRARGLSVENVLQAEDFKDLIDRLTPAYSQSE